MYKMCTIVYNILFTLVDNILSTIVYNILFTIGLSIVIGLLYKAERDACQHRCTNYAEAKALSHEGFCAGRYHSDAYSSGQLQLHTATMTAIIEDARLESMTHLSVSTCCD